LYIVQSKCIEYFFSKHQSVINGWDDSHVETSSCVVDDRSWTHVVRGGRTVLLQTQQPFFHTYLKLCILWWVWLHLHNHVRSRFCIFTVVQYLHKNHIEEKMLGSFQAIVSYLHFGPLEDHTTHKSLFSIQGLVLYKTCKPLSNFIFWYQYQMFVCCFVRWILITPTLRVKCAHTWMLITFFPYYFSMYYTFMWHQSCLRIANRFTTLSRLLLCLRLVIWSSSVFFTGSFSL